MTPKIKTPLTDAAVAAIYQGVGEVEIVRADFARDLETTLTAQTAAAQTMEDALVDALDSWTPFYEQKLGDIDLKMAECQREDDGYGRNFFEGKQSGLASIDIWLTKLKDLRAAIAKSKEAK